MKRPVTWCVLVVAAATAATVLRLPKLAQRPMHGDEAVHAVKFAELLQQGRYRYDPNEYHGPTLNYLTLIPARLGSQHNLAELDEFTLRIVPVFFGILLVLLVILVWDGLGGPAAFFAMVLTAVSPAFVFYSRYYIHEMLLVCFSFAVIVSGYRYLRSGNLWWVFSVGTFVGLAHATKETFIIVFVSMLSAALFVRLSAPNARARNIKTGHLLIMAVTAVLVSALFYSSFLTYPSGILDSFRTYANYFARGSISGSHVHPWYYYLKMLLWSRYGDGPLWSEGFVVLLAALGLALVVLNRGLGPAALGLVRFIAFYTLVMAVIYSAVPYKTPWCLLGFYHGMILLAGIGAAALLRWASRQPIRLFVGLLLAMGTAHLAWQAYLGSYRFYADSRNPYVYAHPTTDVIRIAKRLEKLSALSPKGTQMPIQVICPGADYWPLPWYLRRFERVYWWSKIETDVPPAPVVIASPAVEDQLRRYLYNRPAGKQQLYVPLFKEYIELRPSVEIRCYVTKQLLDRCEAQQDSVADLKRSQKGDG